MATTLDNVRVRLISENKSLSISAKGQKPGTRGWTQQPQIQWSGRQNQRWKARGPFPKKDFILCLLQKEPVPYLGWCVDHT